MALDNENGNDYDDVVSLDGQNSQDKAAEVARRIYDEEQRRAFEKLFKQEEFLGFIKWLFNETGYGSRESKASGDLYIRTGERNIGQSVADRIMQYAPGNLERVLSYRIQPDPSKEEKEAVRK